MNLVEPAGTLQSYGEISFKFLGKLASKLLCMKAVQSLSTLCLEQCLRVQLCAKHAQSEVIGMQ